MMKTLRVGMVKAAELRDQIKLLREEQLLQKGGKGKRPKAWEELRD